MALRRRVRRRRRRYAALLTLGIGMGAIWWGSDWIATQTAPDDRAILPLPPVITTDRPEVPEQLPPQTDISEKGAEGALRRGGGSAAAEAEPTAAVKTADSISPSAPHQPASGDHGLLAGAPDGPNPSATILAATPARSESKPPPTGKVESLITLGKQAIAAGNLVAARAHFSGALELGVSSSDASVIRTELSRIGQETILSPRIIEGDPFVTRYVVQAGDSLAKIATANKLTVDLLAEINGIRDKNMIRAGQSLKVIKGPFHAQVNKSEYTLDVYLDKTFIRHFRVGLGADNSTPTGRWQVATKLVNPTYYPPRGGDIISADDPQNPLGERWIGLVGVAGEALGQERYGIHGTNEPNSIGRSVSLGCVRMYNEDVEAVYNYLVEKHSTVTIAE